jgi:DNA invertase Pin-like site-specific DNA recombinase
MTNAALYARISYDPSGQELGVKRQLEDARALAQQRGWCVVDEYIDNDISAYSGAERPDYERLMADIDAGRVNRIVIWQPSRLWRRRAERVRDIERLSRLNVGVVSVRGPEWDFSNGYGRSMAVIMGEMDTLESENKSERQIRANKQKAERGRPATFAPYGWRRVYETDASGRTAGWHDEVNTEEAAVVQEAVRRLLDGDSESAIIRDFTGRGVPTPRRTQGASWTIAGLKSVVMRPSNVAQRVHRGEVVGPGDWQPILEQDDYDRVVALLRAPERRRRRDGKRRHLLSYGLGVCGVCGSHLDVATFKRGDKTRSHYRCATKGCVARDQAQVDAAVSIAALRHLSRPEARGAFDGDDAAAKAARERAEAIRARMNTAADQYAEEAIDAVQLARITERLRPELAAAEAEAKRHRPVALPANAAELHGARAAEVWEAWPVATRRAVLELLGLEVRILPTGRSRVFELENLEIRWR